MIEDTSGSDDIDSYSSLKNVDSVITVIAILHVVTAALTLPLVYEIFTSTYPEVPVWFIFLIMTEGAILGVTIPLYIVIGVAIWLVYQWAWKVSVVTNLLCLIFNIFGAALLTALFNIIILLALNSTDVKQALQPVNQ